MCVKNIAFVQKDKGEYPNINFLTAAIALKRFFGYRIVHFERVEEILHHVTKETMVFGGVPVMDKVFMYLGVFAPPPPYYPIELEKYLGRRVWPGRVHEVRTEVELGATLFVKPTELARKSFNGRVMAKFLDLLHMHHLDADTLVWCSEPINVITEYRCFIHKYDGVLGCKHYAGDWKKTIDFELPDIMRREYTKSPVAYGLDLGLTDKGETVLIECNDAVSLGCYGLDPSLYGCMLVDRWKELVGE